MLAAKVFPKTDAMEHLGPAEVTSLDGNEIVVRLVGGDHVLARMALAFPYKPAIGDQLLVIGHHEEFYVIGVLQGHGTAQLEFPGNVTLRATDGRLDLEGDQGVRIHGPLVELEADKLTTIAQTAVHKCGKLYQRVRDLLSTHAGKRHELVDGAAFSKSKRTTIVSDDNVMINGKQIHLG